MLFNIIFPTPSGQAMLYHFVWPKKKKVMENEFSKTFIDKWDYFQYFISITFIFTQLYYVGFLNFYIFLGTKHDLIGSAPDHDMYVTHKEKESNKKLDDIDWGEIASKAFSEFYE